jgi:general secretion pathway protein F
LSQQTESKRLQLIVTDLADTIQEGGTLSDGLAKYPSIFSSLYVSITRSGELGGKLEHALGRLSDFLDKEEEMISRVQQAIAYPVFTCAVGLITIVVLMTVVIPRFVVMFEDLGQALPLPTLILVSTSTLMLKFWWLIIAAVMGIGYLLRQRIRSREVKLKLDRLKLTLPVIGILINKIEIARLSRTLATLLDSGIAILPALDAVADTVQNEEIKSELDGARQQVRDGASLGRSLKDAAYLPPYVINMITVGEEGGQLERVLFRIAISYEAQTDKAIRLFMNLLGPALILVMGVIVGFIVISMLLPIFQFNIMIR